MASRSEVKARSILTLAGILTAAWLFALFLLARWLIEAIF